MCVSARMGVCVCEAVFGGMQDRRGYNITGQEKKKRAEEPSCQRG